MRRHREVAAIVALALAALAAAGEPFEAFARRLGLRDTLRTWNIDRLRHGAVAVRREAARALSADGALLSAGALETSERREVLRLVIAALAPDDVAGVRARLELARQSLAEAAGQVDALRGDGGASAASAPVRQSLAQAAELVAPIVEQQPGAIRRGDPLEGLREPAWLLEAWRLVLEGWLERRERQSPRGSIARATALLAGLLDTPPESPLPDQASVDLLRTELGADAALALACALAIDGRDDDASAWLDAISRTAPATAAAARVPATRLALAVDAAQPSAMRAAIERVPARTLPASLAVAAARVAARDPGPDAAAVIAAALDAMDAEARADWLGRLADSAGPLQALATALSHAATQADAWRHGAGDPAAAAAIAAEIDAAVRSSGPAAPSVLRGEALRLRGLALRAAGQPIAASAAFELAAAEGSAWRGECLWLAALTELATDAPGAARRIDLLRRGRAADPTGPFAGRIATWLSRLDAFPSDAIAAAVLLEVPTTDPFASDARGEAARRMLAAAGRDPRALVTAGRRALEALAPFATAPGNARWRLAAAIACDDLAAAGQAERDLTPDERADPVVAASIAWIDLLRGDVAGARAAIEALPAAGRESAASSACMRLASMQGSEARVAEVELACIAAELARPSDASAAVERLARATLRAADSESDLSAPLAGRAAALLVRAPESRLRSGALGEAWRMAGQPSQAIEPLQSLGSALPQGSEAWAEARWRLHRCLRAVDPARAQAMLRQHMTLAPDGGPDPWGERFRRIAGEGAP